MWKSSETFDPGLDSHLPWQHLEQHLEWQNYLRSWSKNVKMPFERSQYWYHILKRNIWVFISNILISFCEPLLISAPPPRMQQHCTAAMAASLLTEPLNYDLKESEVELPLSATASLAAVSNYPGSWRISDRALPINAYKFSEVSSLRAASI